MNARVLTLSAMRRRHKTALVVLLLAASIVGVAVVLWPREPSYQGKRLSQWLMELEGNRLERISSERLSETEAVRQYIRRVVNPDYVHSK